jgi:hypothetical protein
VDCFLPAGVCERKNVAIRLAAVLAVLLIKRGVGGLSHHESTCCQLIAQKLRMEQHPTKICEDLGVSRSLVIKIKKLLDEGSEPNATANKWKEARGTKIHPVVMVSNPNPSCLASLLRDEGGFMVAEIHYKK